MSAIEYGSYYWCVILERSVESEPESIHLHADEMQIDERGSLIFRSAGRRPAGSEPRQNGQGQEQGEKGEKNEAADSGGKDDKPECAGKKKMMTYMAFAPGTWSVVYAAKLTDGAPAVVEHWNSPDGKSAYVAALPQEGGASGYLAK